MPFSAVGSHPYGILKGVVDGKVFVKGTWGAQIIDDLAPAEGDILIEGKRGLDTFASTNLDFILRSKGITTIAPGGFLTNCCVESTMRSGYENGYKVITLSDCLAATSVEEHQNAITYEYPMFSTPMSSEEFIHALGQPAAGGVSSSFPRRVPQRTVRPLRIGSRHGLERDCGTGRADLDQRVA
ncbi:cysteine hydrolase [uncultured Arthrobacter sp.]|mgnify:CR=1 FL=1|uniref:cysteine hydrolase n=1 Tax=uncultured Arthrobacter sp. TaxID=114050 RepID=UPI00321692CC